MRETTSVMHYVEVVQEGEKGFVLTSSFVQVSRVIEVRDE